MTSSRLPRSTNFFEKSHAPPAWAAKTRLPSLPFPVSANHFLNRSCVVLKAPKLSSKVMANFDVVLRLMHMVQDQVNGVVVHMVYSNPEERTEHFSGLLASRRDGG